MKEIILVSDKGGTGKSTLLEALARSELNGIFCDSSFRPNDSIANLGKQTSEMIDSGYVPEIDDNICLVCYHCVDSCDFGALLSNEGSFKLDKEKCTGCGICHHLCPSGAISMISLKAGQSRHWFLESGNIFMNGEINHINRRGTLPVLGMRKKALELAAIHNKPLIVTESLPGLDRHFCSVSRSQIAIIAVVEPAVGSAGFVKALTEVCAETGSRLVVILNKYDIAPAYSSTIRESSGIHLLLELPWQSPEDVELAFRQKLLPSLIKFIESIR